MKFILFFGIFFILQGETIASVRSYSYKNPFLACNMDSLGDFGKHIKEVERLMYRNIDSTLWHVKESFRVLDPNSDLEQTVYCYYKCRADYIADAFDNDSKKLAIRGLRLSEKNQFYFYKLRFHKILAEYAHPNWEDTYYHLLRALEISKQMEDTRETMMVLINITIYLNTFGKIEMAREYLKDIKSYLNTVEVGPDNYIRYYKLASNLEDDFDLSLSYLDTAMQIARSNEMLFFEFKLNAEKAFLFEKHNKIEEAIRALEGNETIVGGMESLEGDLKFLKAKLYLGINQAEKAKVYFEDYLKTNNGKLQQDANYWGFRIYSETKDSLKAFRYHLKYIENVFNEKEKVEDSLFVEFQNKHRLDQLKVDNLLKDERLKLYTFQNRMIIGVGHILLIVLGYIYYLRVKKNKYQLKTTKRILKKEQELNVYRMRFIENISHEIRTPITVLKGVFGFLGEKFVDTEYSSLIEIGERNTQQLKSDVELILHSMAMEPYSRTVQRIPTNLYLFFSELIEQYKLNAFSRGISILFTYNLSNVTNAEIDTDKWATIFRNYLTNAIRFSEENSEIIIRVEVSKKNLKLSVKNFGSFIKNTEYAKVFNRYYQLDHNKVQKSDGIGIGLSITKELADIMSAEVGVESNFDEFSTLFYCSIDIKISQFSNQFQTQVINVSEGEVRAKKQGNIGQKRLLFVDDNESMLQFYKQVFRDVFICDVTLDGLNALKLIEENVYDCIVTDIVMPEIDGFKLVEELNKRDVASGIPVIFVTAHDTECLKIDAYKVGVYDFITKPFVVRELIVRIENVIRNNENRIMSIKEGQDLTYDVKEFVNDDKALLDKLIQVIDENMAKPDFSITMLAEDVFYSKRQLTRKVKELTGLTPSKLILERRLMKAEYILKTSDNIRISEVQNLIGMTSTTYFNKSFKQRFGVTPRDLKKK